MMMKITAILTAILLAFGIASMPEHPVASADTDPWADIAGTVEEMTEEYILFTTADGQTIQANLFPDTLYEGQVPAVGDWISVLYDGIMTRSLPAQIAAVKVSCWQITGVVETLEDESFLLIPSDGSAEVLVNVPGALPEGLAVGSTVTVAFNGVMTMSLPGQISADKIWIRE